MAAGWMSKMKLQVNKRGVNVMDCNYKKREAHCRRSIRDALGRKIEKMRTDRVRGSIHWSFVKGFQLKTQNILFFFW